MKLVFASLPGYGHLYPIMPLALASAAAGHQVTIATGAPFTDRLPLPTMDSLGVTFQMLEHEVMSRYPNPADRLDTARRLFGEVCAERTALRLREAFRADRPDLVVYEVSNVGAAVAAHQLGIPAITFGLGLWNPILREWHDIAVEHLKVTGAETLLRDYLDPVPPSLRTAPVRSIPIRSVAWSQTQHVPDWLTRRNGRPRVYITLGTVVFGATDLLHRAITETAEHDVDVLVAAGPDSDPSVLGTLPENVHIEQFVSQPSVLSLVDLAVHHGGAGTTLGAIAAGLPQLVLPVAADQPFNAAAVARLQAGRALTSEEQVPGAIYEAVGALLTDGPERVSAKRLANEIGAMPSPTEVVRVLERRIS